MNDIIPPTQLSQNLPNENVAGDSAVQEIRSRPLSKLTYRILSFNVLVIFILAMGVSYLGTARKYITQSRLENLETEAALYTAILNAGINLPLKDMVKVEMSPNVNSGIMLGKDKSLDKKTFNFFHQSIMRLNAFKEQKIVIYNARGEVFLNSGEIPMRRFYEIRGQQNSSIIDRISSQIQGLFSVTFRLPLLPDIDKSEEISMQEQQVHYEDLKIAAWSGADGGLILTAFSPLYIGDQVVGGFRVIRRDRAVEDSFAETREEIFRLIVLAMIMTIAHSLYLAASIGHPLRALAVAAEKYRANLCKAADIPDMSSRDDEIGELSEGMRAMARGLELRLSAIEQFAADVSHELKNPLTSLRSALETLPRVTTDENKAELFRIALHDIQRMDRLISDISLTSRLDAELSRDCLILIDIKELLAAITAQYNQFNKIDGIVQRKIKIDFYSSIEPALVNAHAARLQQVFCNLIDNAISFSPIGGSVLVKLENNLEHIKVIIEDGGPGIPENKLNKIFERFYSQRPHEESFGMHSGLGLSIARQIIEAMGGKILAENIKDAEQKIMGARFIVRLKSVKLTNNFNT